MFCLQKYAVICYGQNFLGESFLSKQILDKLSQKISGTHICCVPQIIGFRFGYITL